MPEASGPRPQGISGSAMPGPYPVGGYAAMLRDELRRRARVQLFGEVWNLGLSRAKAYFELRDATGAVPCSMWRNDWEGLPLGDGSLADGAQVVIAGGPDYYPGSATSSPSFSFLVSDLRIAGEGDLLAQLQRLRQQLGAEGLFEPQKGLRRSVLPRTVGVVTGEGSKARDDVIAGLRRRGWAGRVVWAFAPVQDRHAAPAITRALQDLAAVAGVDAIVVARGGGSLADLFAFCDETLCRTVALLPVPVIASVGHHTDRTLIDEVAAASCSTPTHAAEAAVPLHCDDARRALAGSCQRLSHHGRGAVLGRARAVAALSRAPAEHVARHRTRLHQQVRELRATARRRVAARRSLAATQLLVISRQGQRSTLRRARAGAENLTAAAELRRAARGAGTRRARDLDRLALALSAHDPEHTLARGYALVRDADGELVTTASAARLARVVQIGFRDAAVSAKIRDDR
ncbi:MAG: exodeoxyribonuclease VII large subunit [Actinomycetota bacterium]|nr:exodeoxyribonuclease VII large subunit [Actinomycetota bacterium]